MRALRTVALVVVIASPACAGRDLVRDVATYADRVADVMTQLQSSAEKFHDAGILPDEEYQEYLKAAEPVAEAGVKLTQAIQVYEGAPSEETEAVVLAALDSLDLLLPSLFEPLNTSEFRAEVVKIVLETQKLILQIRGDA